MTLLFAEPSNLLPIDNEPSLRTQSTDQPNDANAWVPEGVAGPSTIIRPPTPEHEPQRFSDIGAITASRRDSTTGEVRDEWTPVQQTIALSIAAIVANMRAEESPSLPQETVETYGVLPTPSSESPSSDGLMMAPYDVLRRRFGSRSPSTRGSPQGRRLMVQASSTLRVPSPDLTQRESSEAERQAMQRLRSYARLEDITAQQLLHGYEERLRDWRDGNVRAFQGVFLSRRHDSTELPHGYLPSFARCSLEIVEHARAEMDIFLLSRDDERELVLPDSTHAPVVQRPDLTQGLRMTSVPPTSRAPSDVELPLRARSTSPEATQLENLTSEPSPPIEVPSLSLTVAFLETQTSRQPTAQPAGQQSETVQAGSSFTRDSVVRTSADATLQKRGDSKAINEKEEAAS